MIRLHNEVGLPVAVLVGKSRPRDAELALRKTKEQNLDLIHQSVTALVEAGLEVIFDAEHFFTGFHDADSLNTSYALRVAATAFRAGARWVVLCDTTGAMTPEKVAKAVMATAEVVPIGNLGIHTHNDRGRAIANAESAWKCDIRHVQGTIGGVGERVGNMDLCTFIPNAVLDYKATGISPEQLRLLTPTYNLVCDVLNVEPRNDQPWVGSSAPYTEAGMHASGEMRDPQSYLNFDPAAVGNTARFGVSDQSGKANLEIRLRELGLSFNPEQLTAIATKHQELCDQGANFGLAEASLHLFFL